MGFDAWFGVDAERRPGGIRPGNECPRDDSGQDLDAGTVGCGTKALGPESGKVCRLLKAAGRVEEDKRTSLTA